MIIGFNGKQPICEADVYIAPTAVIIGDVVIKAGASIWFNTVVRGDVERIIIGNNSNVQDNCTLHADPGYPLIIGDDVTVGHNAVIHGCTIEDQVLIGMQATLLNKAVIRTGSIVAAGAVVKEGQHIGPYQLAAGMPAQIKKDFQGVAAPEIGNSASAYLMLAQAYRQLKSDL